jgi:hypothetical protein
MEVMGAESRNIQGYFDGRALAMLSSSGFWLHSFMLLRQLLLHVAPQQRINYGLVSSALFTKKG